ncbi:hypothetical protein HY490_00650 [Candidatus Woesearchaeota archaeon]|nr:hypothetical protein [Candidatus Woesearchaeota archaeon]
MKHRRRQLLLLLGALLVGFVVVEYVLHWVVPVNFNVSAYDTEWHHTFIKNMRGWTSSDAGATFLVTDSDGFRDREHLVVKRGDETRVMVLGDSIIANVAVPKEKMITALLAEKLEESEVINRGVESWDMYLEYLYFRKDGHKYAPDVLVLVFNVGNDFIDIMNPEIVPLFNDSVILVDKFPELSVQKKVRWWLNQHSGVYRLFHSFYYSNIKEHSVTNDGFFSLGFGSEFQEALRRIKVVITAFDALARRQGTRLIVVVHNDPRVTNQEYYQHWADKRKNYIPFEELGKGGGMLVDFLNQSNITYVDNTPYIHELADYVSFEDAHLSAQGSRKFADVLFNAVNMTFGRI